MFSNCREQGLVLTVYNARNDGICIWACQERNSDNIMVVVADESLKDITTNVFNDKAYERKIKFPTDEYDKAVNYVYKVLRKVYEKSLNLNVSYTFEMTRGLNDIEKIRNDASELDYEDYHELAVLEDKNTNIACDLIIKDGKFGLRFSTFDHKTGDYENKFFKECDVDLSNDTSLFLSMKEQLEKYIDYEIDYDIEFAQDNIKI